MKAQLELNYNGKDTFLNYWDSEHGDDVCARILEDGFVEIDEQVVPIELFFKIVKVKATKI